MEADRRSNISVVDIVDIGAVIGKTVDQHLQLDHAQRRVIEYDNLDGQIMHARGDQFAQEHCEATVTRDRDNLTIRVCDLGANSHRESIRHRTVEQRANQATAPEGIDVTRSPHVTHTGVGSEDCILCSNLVEDVCRILGMDRLHVLRIARVGADGGVHDLRVFLHLCLEESIRTIAVKQR